MASALTESPYLILNVCERIVLIASANSKVGDALKVLDALDPVLVTIDYGMPADTDEFNPPHLGAIYQFHRRVQEITTSSSGRTLAICVSNLKYVTNAVLLLAGHLLFGSDDSVEDVFSRVDLLSSFIASIQGSTIEKGEKTLLSDCLEAMYNAKSRGWVNFSIENIEEKEINTFIDMDEYMHYDDSHNGKLHLVDPDRLLLLRPPCDLAEHRSWMDPADGSRRVFSAAHYAHVLPDFDVKLLIRCGGADYDDQALRAAGIEVEELVEDPAGSLAAVDRLLTLVKLVPGRIALECGEGEGATARLLVAAHLVKNKGFGAAAAVAWVRLVHPVAPGSAPELLVWGAGDTQSV
jgi:hypothetical protein